MHDEIGAFVAKKLIDKANLLSLDPPEMTHDLPLTGAGLLDSMDFFSLITDVEEQFGIEMDFADKDPAEFSTLGGFVACAVEALEHQ